MPAGGGGFGCGTMRKPCFPAASVNCPTIWPMSLMPLVMLSPVANGSSSGEEGAAAQEVAVPAVARVAELPDNLARIVDGARIGDYDGQRVIEGDVSAAGAAAVEEAVVAAGVLVRTRRSGPHR